MKISLNWIKKYADIDLPVDRLTPIIGARLVEVENVDDIGRKYKDVIIAKVVECEKVEGSDHLSDVKLDDGLSCKGVERDDNGYVQVVCGAPNMRKGISVAWLPPKSTVPNTYGTAEEFVLDSRKLRGITSHGMVASARELDLSDDHEGILEIEDGIKPGLSFASAYGLDDYVLDIENKSLTHRPDCFGVIGFAREVSAILGHKFNTPDWLMVDKDQECENIKTLAEISVKIDDSIFSPRYLAVVMDGAMPSKKSSIEIQSYLARSGVRPINAIVDITNYLMLLTGQPLHAFDYNKLMAICGPKVEIHVRSAKKGEKLKLLDGKQINLEVGDIVIAAGDTPIALAGAMGGESTAIDESTSRIVIESASFNLYNLRSTQMRHGIFSEAITRFTKGQSPELTYPVIKQAIRMVGELTGAKAISRIVEDYPEKYKKQTILLNVSDINATLGKTYTVNEVIEVLERVEFIAEKDEKGLIKVIPPYWRSDIHIKEDVIEEIGRIVGFDNIKPSLSIRYCTAVNPTDFDQFRAGLRKILKSAGANEILSYSFIHGNIMEKAGLDKAESYRLVNSISQDLQYYRQTLTPSLLAMAYMNIKQGYDKFALYEINKTHRKSNGYNDEGVPVETHSFGLVFAEKQAGSSTTYYLAKNIVEYIASRLNVHLKYIPLVSKIYATARPFEDKRSATIIDVASNQPIGVVGEYKNSVVKAFKLPRTCAGFEIDLDSLFNAACQAGNRYTPISRFPGVERDICFKVAKTLAYDSIIDSLGQSLAKTGYSYNIEPLDIYCAKDCKTKNITVRVKLTSFDHTLTGKEVMDTTETLINDVIKKTKAEVI